METPIADFVRRYADSGMIRAHMPGHKGKSFLGCETLDITEIQGADSLYEAEGIIRRSESYAGELFGSGRTVYSTEGSSQCIRAMLYLALTCGNGSRTVVAARNVHRAFVYAAALLDFEIVWLWPERSTSLCGCPVSPDTLERTLATLPAPPAAVYLTSPDYLGFVQDIAGLSAVCHAHGLPLLVDNAHGAYLHFLKEGSRHPIQLGADLCCDSAHKTLPVLTGGAYLHLGPSVQADEAAVRNALALFGSTSPSYLILQSLDACNRQLTESYPAGLQRCCSRLSALRGELNAAAQAAGCPVPLTLDGPGREPLKLTLDAAALGMTGTALADALRGGQLECEYADPRYVVLMFTPCNPPQDYARLRIVLRQCLHSLPAAGGLLQPEELAGEFMALAQQARAHCTIRQAVFAPQERIPVQQALGRICAMPTVSCPPAIPIAVSGEEITPAALELMQRYGVTEVSVLRR